MATKIVVPIGIVTCPMWGARPSKEPIQFCGAADKIIIHHTAGHHQELDPQHEIESGAEAYKYARDIQNYHMDSNGWIDSGHNFLVCRNGIVLQGRWRTVSRIEAGGMVVSAHCPGQNENVGIEHEHLGTERMTNRQFNASARLIAWISGQYGLEKPLPLHPHKEYYGTECPANLTAAIPQLYNLASQILKASASL